MTCGIYKLNFNHTSKVYIGKSSYIEGRFLRHLRSFEKGTNSTKLQKGYDNFGVPTLEILVECTEEELNNNENEAIQIFNAVDEGFNTLYTAEDTPYNIGSTNGMSKFSEEQIISVLFMLLDINNRYSQISETTKVSEQVVRNVASGGNHCWLANDYPEEYKKMLELKGTRYTRTNDKNASFAKGITYPLVISPTGEIHNITNVTQFAKVNGLQQANLRLVLIGKRNMHKGWKRVEPDTGF